jgi:hypothetical protein
MMIKVVQKYASSASQESECTSLNDIYEIPFVRRWVQDPAFHRLCKSTLSTDGHLLVCETNKGQSHWVIAVMYGEVSELNLPEWKK